MTFIGGQSGNPRGRPKGSRGKYTVAVERLMEADAENVARAVIKAAVSGADMVAARLVLERVAPLRRGRPIPFDLPKIEAVGDVVVAIAAVTEQVSSGLLSPDEGALICGLVELHRRALETIDFEARISRLEAKNA